MTLSILGHDFHPINCQTKYNFLGSFPAILHHRVCHLGGVVCDRCAPVKIFCVVLKTAAKGSTLKLCSNVPKTTVGFLDMWMYEISVTEYFRFFFTSLFVLFFINRGFQLFFYPKYLPRKYLSLQVYFNRLKIRTSPGLNQEIKNTMTKMTK